GKYRASPVSRGAPAASLKTPSVARRGSGTRPSTPAAICAARGPETRTTPTPPRPGGVAIAAMVSPELSPRSMGASVSPLTRDANRLLGGPPDKRHPKSTAAPRTFVLRLRPFRPRSSLRADQRLLRASAQVFFCSAATSLLMRHCCAIDSSVLVSQYSTRPAGNHAIITAI